MKKATMLFLVAMIVSAAVTLVCTEAKAVVDDCACWYASYNPSQFTCEYHFCLPPLDPEHPADGDYILSVWDPYEEVWDDVELQYDGNVPCAEGCVTYWGDFRWDYFPEIPEAWVVLDKDREQYCNSELRNCLE